MKKKIYKDKEINKISRNLINDGYVIKKNLLDARLCLKLKNELISLQNDVKKNQYFIDEGSNKGQFIIRDLVLRKPKIFLNLIDNKFVLAILEKVYRDKFILDNIMASNSINVDKNYSRNIHIDSQMPISDINCTTDIVVLMCLDEFKKQNGATKVWPKSHLSGIRIHHNKSRLKNNLNNYKILEAPAGSAAIILGQTWHQLGQNISSDSRWSIFIHYKRWWMKSSTNFTKCGNKIYNLLNKQQKELFGFNCISPRFDFKKKISHLYMLRNSSKISKSYKKALKY